MNRPEDELARKLVQHLDHGVDHLEPGVRQRLLVARNAALSHYRGQAQTARGLAWAGPAAAWFGDNSHTRQLFVLSALALALAGYFYFQGNGGPASEIAEIDANLLTDELPVNAYLDKGFDSWLKRSSR